MDRQTKHPIAHALGTLFLSMLCLFTMMSESSAAPRQPVHRSVDELNQILFRAAELGRIPLMENVLEQGAQATFRNDMGETPLHAAAAHGQMRAAQLLIREGADTNARTVKNWTPLHSAARFGHTSIASYLINNGAKVNMWNTDHKTPLGLAEFANKQPVAYVIRRYGGR